MRQHRQGRQTKMAMSPRSVFNLLRRMLICQMDTLFCHFLFSKRSSPDHLLQICNDYESSPPGHTSVFVLASLAEDSGRSPPDYTSVCLCLLRWLPGHVLWLFWGEMGGGVGRSIRSRVKLCLQIRHSSLFQYLAAVGGPLERALPFNTSRLQSAAVSLVVVVYHLICFRFLHKLVLASASQGMASYRSFLSRNHVCTSLLTAEGGAPL